MYTTVQDLPSTLRKTLPPDAQTLYLQTYNQVWEEQSGLNERLRDRVAHRLAWEAMTAEFVFDENPNRRGPAWHRSGEMAVVEKAAKRGILARLGWR